MKGKICGLLLACFTMLMSLFVVSSDVSALKYQISTIPYGLAVTKESLISHSLGGYRISYAFNDPFRIGAGEAGVDFKWSDKVLNNYTVTLTRSGNDPDYRCSYRQGRRIINPEYSTTSPFSYDFDYPYYASDLAYTGAYGARAETECNPLKNVRYRFNLASFPPYVFGQPNYRGLYPYRVNSSGIYVSNTATSDDGLTISTKLDFMDLFDPDNRPTKIYQLRIPFGRFQDNVDIDVGTTFEFYGTFYVDTEEIGFQYHQPNISLSSKGYPNGWTTNPITNNTLGSSSCQIDYKSNPNENEAPHLINYYCIWTSNYDFQDSSLLGFTLNINSSSDNPFISTNNEYIDNHLFMFGYDASYVITNGDSTPAGVPFSDYEIFGDIEAIGQVEFYEPSDGGWLGNLINLFDFSFLNPFSGLFGLFSDQSSCASIPTFASMLNSNESTICPWFDSTTRNIVTPVLGLASMMLIFGFTVRWLGSRSGNFVEDSGGVDSGGYHFENKFRRKK